MTLEEYKKRIDFVFEETEKGNPFLRDFVKYKFINNFNRHNAKVIKELCVCKMYDLIGIEHKKINVYVKENK